MCVSGAQLAAAMVDDNVDTVLLPSDVALEQGDFTGYTLPIVINRNFTILGTEERLVTFDLSLLRDKARMGNGTTMTLRRVLTQNSKTTTFQTNGLDLMAPMPPNEQATIWADQGVGLRVACMPLEQSLVAIKSPLGSRPPTIPGTNVYEMPVAQPPGCVNSSTAPPLDRCYAYAYRSVDVAMYGATVGGPNGTVVPNGYVVRGTDWISLCVSVFPAECFERFNAPGCGVAFTSRPPPALDPAVNGSTARGGFINPGANGNFSREGTSVSGGLQGGNSRERKRVLALGLGCGLGGAGVGAIALLLLFGFRTNERAQQRSACAQKAGTGAMAAPEEASCAADHACPHDTTIGAQPANRERRPATAANSLHAAGNTDCIHSGISGVIASGNPPAPGPTHSHSMAPRPQGARGGGTTGSGWGHRQHQPVSPFTPIRKSLELKAKLIPAALALTAPTPTLPQPNSGHAPATASAVIGAVSAKDGGEAGAGANGAKAGAAPAAGGAARGGDNVATPGGDTDVVTLLPTVLGKGACGRVQEGLYRGQRVAVKVMLTEEGWNGAPGGGVGGWRGGGDGLNGPTPPAPSEQPQQVASAAEAAASEHVTPLFPAARVETEGQLPSPSARGVEQARSASQVCISLDLLACTNDWANISCDAEGTRGRQEGGGDGVPRNKAGVDSFEGKARSEQARLLATEVEVLGRCDHPNVVRLLAACLTPPRMCLVMELCQTSLERMIYGDHRAADNTPLIPLPKLLHIGIQICQGLEYLHPTIVHRDLKPGNVLINGADTDRPVAKLADFGLSRIRAMTQSTQNPEAGTPAYIAPECYDTRGNVILHHSDMYSLGVLLWAMLTGQHPWQGYTVAAVAFKVALKGERLPMKHLPESRCPRKLRNLIQQCWDADPRRRPAAAEAVKQLTLVHQALAAAPSGALLAASTSAVATPVAATPSLT